MDGLSGIAPLLSGGSAIAGTGANLLQDVKKDQYQNYVMNLLKNPQALAAMVAKLQQPLNNGLTQSVGNQVQGNMAERGLSQAPGVFAGAESQALAPFYQQNQSTATQALLQALGLPPSTFGSPINTSGAWQGFLKGLPPQSNGNWNGQFGTGGITDPSLGSISAMPSGYGGSVGPDPTAPIYDPSWGGGS
jgi:hypothetical protein